MIASDLWVTSSFKMDDYLVFVDGAYLFRE